MARKRPRPRRKASTSKNDTGAVLAINGKLAGIRMLNTTDEGTLYHMPILTRPPPLSKSMANLARWKTKLGLGSKDPTPNPLKNVSDDRRRPTIPQSSTLNACQAMSPSGAPVRHQYTISTPYAKKKPFLHRHCGIGHDICMKGDVENNHYRPSSWLFRYINWTFYASFLAVFTSFTIWFMSFCLFFGILLKWAGDKNPECIVVSGQHYGTNPDTKFSDAFALSWTTFTTVGYGMTYTTTGNDFEDAEARDCSWIVFLCTAESFLGLLYAGMCAAILFGKVNRVQSHANLIFSNSVCMQYEEVQVDAGDDDGTNIDANPNALDDFAEDALDDSDKDSVIAEGSVNGAGSGVEDDDDNGAVNTFVDNYQGCPVLKFQVINEYCNQEGGEMIDGIMKVIALKFTGKPGTNSYSSQYVRVPLVDSEHPFFHRVWHGVHILDQQSPLLTAQAKKDLAKQEGGAWPEEWFDPEIIKKKLEFSDLIMTVAGISNISAVTVHGYKRYKRGDVLIGFDFAPTLYRNMHNKRLEVDLSLAHDVLEQAGGGAEELDRGNRLESSIRIQSSRELIKLSRIEEMGRSNSDHDLAGFERSTSGTGRLSSS